MELVKINSIFIWYAEAANAVSVPSKVECLNGISIKMVALGSEHSVAATGLKDATHFKLLACFLITSCSVLLILHES